MLQLSNEMLYEALHPMEDTESAAQRGKQVCPMCKKQVKHIQALRQHMLARYFIWNNEYFYCRACSFICRDLNGLISHFIATHDINKPYECRVCQARYKTSDSLLMHKMKSHEKKFIPSPPSESNRHQHHHAHTNKKRNINKKMFHCNFCTPQRRYERKRDLMHHIEQNHMIAKPFSCSFCQATFMNELRLKQHACERAKRLQCLDGLGNKLKNAAWKYGDEQNGWKRFQLIIEQELNANYFSGEGKIVYETQGSHALEIDFDDMTMKNLCSGKISKLRLCLEMCEKKKAAETRQLELNDLMGGSETTAVIATQRTTKRLPFICQYCRKALKTQRSLTKHVQQMHIYPNLPEQEKMMQCKVCKKTCNDKDQLKKHFIQHHMNQEDEEQSQQTKQKSSSNKCVHTCLYCKKQYLKLQSLQLHYIKLHFDKLK